MPFCTLTTYNKLSDEQKKQCASMVVDALFDIAGKPKECVMVEINDDHFVTLNKNKPAACLTINTITLDEEIMKKLGEYLSQEISAIIGLKQNCIYISFRHSGPEDWAINGKMISEWRTLKPTIEQMYGD